MNDLAGLLSTPRFFCPMLMDSHFALRPLTSGKKSIFLPDVNGLALRATSINIEQKNRGVLNRPAKSFIES